MTEAKSGLIGHVALVTGGSRGIGRAACLELAAKGAAVGVNYLRDESAAAQVVDRIRRAGGRAVPLQADVGDRAAVGAMVARAEHELGPVDILVNNAGIWRLGSVLEYQEADFDDMWRTNVKGAVYGAAAVAPGMIERGWGRIINVASNAGVGTAMPGTTLYAATKAALLVLTKRMALELGEHGITANAVLPGYVRTDMTVRGRSEQQIAQVTESLNRRSMLGQGVGEPEDIAHVIAFVASEESRFMTGQLLMADGGRMDYLSHV